jgi:type IV secretory pathway TraG/TraD family ATPase VirD4
VFAGFLLIVQVARRLRTGEWFPGNPVDQVKAWFAEGRDWGVPHTVVAVLLAAPLLLALLWAMDRGARKRKRLEHIDSRAQYLGDGRTMRESVVKVAGARLTTAPEFGLKVAHLVKGTEAHLVPSDDPKVQAKQRDIIKKEHAKATPLWAGWRDGMTCIMGPGSGKTTAIAVPLALEAPGAVFLTSNRPDVVEALLYSRNQAGEVWVFDPQEVADMPPTWRYDLLAYIADAPKGKEVKARLLAKQFAESGRPLETKTDAFFDPAGQDLLANMLLAAALGKRNVTIVLEWLSNVEDDTPIDILEAAGYVHPAHDMRAVYTAAEKTRSSIVLTALTMVKFLSNQDALAWVEPTGPDDDRPVFSPAAFVRSTGDTMICLSREGVGSFGPVVAALTVAVTEAAEAFAKTCPGGRLPVPLVFVLDEVANVCRIKELPDWYSHFGGRGLFVIAILQSWAQGQFAWGDQGMKKLWGATVIRVVGRGISDVAFAGELSDMCDQIDVKRHTRSSSSARKGGGSTSRSETWTREQALTKGQIMAMPEWRCLIIPSGERPVLAQQIPWWRRSDEMEQRVKTSQAKFAARHLPELEKV